VRVLLTGSAGFIGSVIAATLVEQGHSLTRVDKRTGIDARDFFRDWDSPSRRYDLVIHCAAVVGGRVLIESPMAHAENLEIDAGLFRWAEHVKPGRIVYVSSVAAYPAGLQRTLGGALYEEDIDLTDTWAPDELYGWAKLTGEVLASRSSVPVSVVRPFTVYGSGQDPVFPFANIALQFRERRNPVTVWGTGNQVRDFIHVKDVVRAIITMAVKEIDGPVNLCTGRALSLRELIALFAEQAGYDPEISTADKPEGLIYRVGCPERLLEFYTPAMLVEEGITEALKGP
jgi:nucleoside-diphosphate-sugar epimerase